MPTIGNLGTMFVRDENGKFVPVPCIQGKNGITPHIGENGNWWIGETDTGAMADNKKYPVSAAVYETIITGKPSEYTLEILLKDGEMIRAKLPNMGLTPDDVVEIGKGEPSEFDDINYKQFYLDKNTGRLYINTSNMYPNSYITIGCVVLSGENDPTGGESAYINNLYINTTTGAIFLCVRMESFMPSEPPHPVWQQIVGTGGDVGTDITLGITGAVVGQTVKITEVDQNGKPVTWEAADIPAQTDIDNTLSVEGSAADAKAVGDKLTEVSEAIANIPSGKDGVGIQSVVQTTTSTEDGGTNVVTVTTSDGTSSTFQVKNGSKGSTGKAGADGHTPVKGTDYFTAADKREIAEEAAGMVSIPDKLPNPNAITFTGAATGTYDGSKALTVEIPIGGGGSGGAVSWKLIRTINIVSGTSSYSFDTDNNGNAFKVKNFLILIDEYPSKTGYLEIKPNNNFLFVQRPGGKRSYPFSFMMKRLIDVRYILENSLTNNLTFERKISVEYSSFGEFTSFSFWFSDTPESDTTMYILGEDV